MSLRTDKSILDATKTLVDELSFEGFKLQDVYTFPDDFKDGDPSLNVPFATVGLMEDETRVLNPIVLTALKANYRVYARFVFADEPADPASMDLAKIEICTREVQSVLVEALFNNTTFKNTVRVAGDVQVNLAYFIVSGRPFTGCQVSFPVQQEV